MNQTLYGSKRTVLLTASEIAAREGCNDPSTG